LGKKGKKGTKCLGGRNAGKGDVYVADQFGAKRNGPTIGDNVGNAIYARTGNGIVYDGALRDLEGLKEIGGSLLTIPAMIHLFIIREEDRTGI
jgi:regulator of RNase E activity RraA